MKPPSKKMKSNYISDPILFNRVGKFLDDNIDKPVIDKEAMVDALRDTYMEYKRKSRGSFRACVFKAYDLITQVLSESVDTTINLSADDDVDDEDVSMDLDETMNPGVISELTPSRGSPVMYIQSVKSMANANAARNNTSELINISSDEESFAPEDELPPVQQAVTKPEIHARALIGRNSAITISTVNPKFPNKKKLLGKRKFVTSSTDLSRKHSAPSIPKVTFRDFGGNSKVIEAVSGLLMHLNYYYIYSKLGVPPPRGFLLHGPPGCGKTLLAKAIAGELGIPLIKTAGPELVGGLAGESEQRIRELFAQAKESSPCIIFIDEIDVIFPPRESARKEMERRIVAQILSSFDDLNDSAEGEGIAVIGATTNPGSLDPALRRAGRFDREICLGIPDRSDRKSILEVLCRTMKISKNISLETVAILTPGYVGADLNALFSQAGIAAVTRSLNENQKINDPAESKKNKITIDNINVEKSAKSNEIADAAENNEMADKTESKEMADETESKEMADKTGSKEMADKTESKENDKDKLGNKEENGTETSKGNNGIEVKPSASTLLKRVFELKSGEIDNLEIEMVDVLDALKLVQPSSKREGFATVPDVSWNDIGSLREIREKLDVSIMIPVKYPKLFEKIGIRAPSGILLYGPPGCGKTLVAKAVANEANINFISVKGPELLNMYVGESERAVRQCFQRARNSQPCVIFFDEIDALCPRRSGSKEGSFSSRVVNQVLTEMDGVEDRQGVFLMAATNRPDMVDTAVLRPGRLDKLVYVGLPNADDRVDILRALTKNGTKPQLSNDISLEEVGKDERCSRYSGADLAALIREASILALNEYVKANESVDSENFDVCVTASHFYKAFDQITPSVSEMDHERYEKFHSLYGTIKDK